MLREPGGVVGVEHVHRNHADPAEQLAHPRQEERAPAFGRSGLNDDRGPSLAQDFQVDPEIGRTLEDMPALEERVEPRLLALEEIDLAEPGSDVALEGLPVGAAIGKRLGAGL